MRNILIFFFLIFAWNAHPQDSIQTVELAHYVINNHKFEQVLDSYLDSEEVHSYYKDNLPLCIYFWVMPKNRAHKKAFRVVSIESIPDTNELLAVGNYGYTYYKQHLICLWSDSAPDVFSKTGERKKFTYVDDMKRIPPRPAVYDGDPGSSWMYKYYRDEFSVMHKKRGIK